ncbi:uncharacterized protein [Drosophila kikkawai]|uniref:Uncharacterized protein n=1 Tax=Drosophila kikkawai TaxID=30033 RepID=A0A6P4I241_DROKI|nr:uncharacterized protein LOC108070687 [Drosophila kikkawai]
MDKLRAMKLREEHLRNMDAFHMDSLLPSKIDYISTSRADYVDHTATAVHNPPSRQTQMDPSLITGHFANNLKVRGGEEKTKTWPQSMDWREDYAQFVKRNKWCNENLYKLFFVCPPVDYRLLENYFKDLRKSIYMYDFSRDTYISKVRQRRSVLGAKAFEGDYLTTYGCYHNRLQDIESLRSHCYPEAPLKNMTLDRFSTNMRKLFTKYNLTTYFDEICAPALLKAKNGIMPSGPIDRYQFRKY